MSSLQLVNYQPQTQNLWPQNGLQNGLQVVEMQTAPKIYEFTLNVLKVPLMIGKYFQRPLKNCVESFSQATTSQKVHALAHFFLCARLFAIGSSIQILHLASLCHPERPFEIHECTWKTNRDEIVRLFDTCISWRGMIEDMMQSIENLGKEDDPDYKLNILRDADEMVNVNYELAINSRDSNENGSADDLYYICRDKALNMIQGYGTTYNKYVSIPKLNKKVLFTYLLNLATHPYNIRSKINNKQPTKLFGVGSSIIDEIIRRAWEEGVAGVILNALLSAVEFYRKFEFIPVHADFDSYGIGWKSDLHSNQDTDGSELNREFLLEHAALEEEEWSQMEFVPMCLLRENFFDFLTKRRDQRTNFTTE